MADEEREEINFRDSAQYVAGDRLGQQWKRSIGLAHGKTQADIYAEAAAPEKSVFTRARDFLKIQIFLWAWHYLRSRFGPKRPFPDYSTTPDDRGVYDLTAPGSSRSASEPVKLALTGDWGSGTENAFDVAQAINLDFPHFTVHLGDIYYVGTNKEVQANMLGGRVHWPLGSRGSFALNANHEMYSRGSGYFDSLLPALGMQSGHGQGASFFCLKNDYWLVIGLDTGYYSVGLPIIELLYRPSCKQHTKIIEWLRNDVRLQDDDRRGLILLSHHQYYSQFESGYETTAAQLAQLIQRPVLWFWGHEHRFAIYGKNATKKAGLEVYGRCVGHGGLPIEDIRGTPRAAAKYQNGLVLYDRRARDHVGDLQIPVGYNGYANLTFSGRQLTIDYKDTQQLLITERWEVGAGGKLKGVAIRQLVEDDDLVLHTGATLEDAIK